MKRKKFITITIGLMFIFLVGGCAMQDYGRYTESVSSSNAYNSQALVQYFQAKADTNRAIIQALKDEHNTAEIALYAILSGQQDTMVANALRSQFVKKPTTVNDIWVGVAKSTVPTAIRWGAGAFIAHDLVNGLTATDQAFNLSGEGNTVNLNSNNAGAFNSSTTGSITGTFTKGDSVQQYNAAETRDPANGTTVLPEAQTPEEESK